MTISVITATYNSAATVRDTLMSVRRQSHPQVEHLVIDGGSTDATLSIVSEFPHVARVVSERDKGIYDAMNKGIALATGDIIAILNSDDFYAHDQVLAHVADTFARKGSDAVYGDLHYVDPERTDRITRRWVSGEYVPGSFRKGWMPPHPSFFVKRGLYDRFGTFNLGLKSAADYELMLRFIEKNGVVPAYLPEVLVKMRSGGHSNKNLKTRLLGNLEDRKAWEMNGLDPAWYTFYLKPARKIIQFLSFLR